MCLDLARNHLRTRSSLSRIIISSVAFALALAIALKPVLQGMNGFSLASAPQSDFALAIYYPVRAFLDRANPYDQSAYLARYPVRNAFAPYLPSTLLLHLPLGLMPLGTAAFLYLVAEVLSILVLAVISLRASSQKVS